MKFKNQFMVDMAWESNDETEIVKDDIVETSRWSEIHVVIFSYKDKYYQSNYSRGLTEQQDESPYECDGEEIECAEVHQVEKMVKVWETI